jgi:hypothetical protein
MPALPKSPHILTLPPIALDGYPPNPGKHLRDADAHLVELAHNVPLVKVVQNPTPSGARGFVWHMPTIGADV